jgi:thiamine biosynthesis lipoprotein
VDHSAGTITRPPGLRIDLGGSGKGHVADRVAALLASARAFVVDAGGDVALRGEHEVHVAHPLGAEPAASLRLADTAIATSSVARRAWRTADGTAAHHLLDPATGRPAWTGLLSATALAPTVLEAETLAKIALLSGSGAVLEERGGVTVDEAGQVSTHGALA